MEWSIAAFHAAETVGEVIVALPPGESLEEGGAIAVEGGSTRSESVARALERTESEVVVVHDAARPLVTPELIDAIVTELFEREDLAGLIAAAPLTDTIKEAGEGDVVERTLDRARLWAAQTPQAFRAGALRDAYEKGDLTAATDDAMLVEQAGGKIALHEAPRENFKVTTALDLRIAEHLLTGRLPGQ